MQSDLEQNYYTIADADSAITSASTQLKAAIENPQGDSLGADLFNNYYTKVDTDGAIVGKNKRA